MLRTEIQLQGCNICTVKSCWINHVFRCVRLTLKIIKRTFLKKIVKIESNMQLACDIPIPKINPRIPERILKVARPWVIFSSFDQTFVKIESGSSCLISTGSREI